MINLRKMAVVIVGCWVVGVGCSADRDATSEPVAERLDEEGCLLLVEKHEMLGGSQLAYEQFDVEILSRCHSESDQEDIKVQQCLLGANDLSSMEGCVPNFSRTYSGSK